LPSVAKFRAKDLGLNSKNTFQCVLVNPPWDKGVKPKQILDMNLDKLVNDGLIMIWIEKEHLVEIIKGFE